MYRLHNGYVMQTAGWEMLAGLGATPLKTLYATYRRIFLNLNEDIHDVLVQIDMDVLKSTLISDTRTVDQWLLDNGDNVLPVSSSPKRLDLLNATRYVDLTHREHSVLPVAGGYSYNPSIVNDKTPDLLVKGNFTAKNSLCTVGGYLHHMQDLAGGTTVFKGFDTISKAPRVSQGFHDFSEVATVDQQRIVVTDISVAANGLAIKVNGDLTKQTPLLVIGGFLFTVGKAVTVLNKNTLFLDYTSFDWPSLIFHSRNDVDQSYLELTHLPGSPNGLLFDEVYHVDTVTRFLLGPYSFVVLLTPHDATQPLARTDYFLEDVGTRCGKYLATKPPAGILVNDVGHVLNYTNQWGDGQVVVSVNKGDVTNYVYHQRPWRWTPMVDNTRDLPSRIPVKASQVTNINFYQLK